MYKYASLVRFKKYKKWRGLTDIGSLEVPLAFILTVGFSIFVINMDIHSNITTYQEPFKNICITIASALIGIIGILLAGISIVTGTISKEVQKIICKLNDKDSIERILISFEFIAFIIGFQIVAFIAIYLSLFSPEAVVNKYAFYAIFAVMTYLLFFTIFYVIGLVGNCIKVFSISNTYHEVLELKKDFFDKANEIRIDFILNTILTSKTNKEAFLIELRKFVQAHDIEGKEELIKYFDDYYK